MNRIMIAGTGSSCGKTTVVCALLSAYKARGLALAAFKCGPDYIDPMFHREIASVDTHNLDPFFYDGKELRRHLMRHAGRDLTILEAAMGYYDGLACTDQASSYEVARETQTPVVLVLDARHTGNSLGAVLEGFKNHKPESLIKGVIWNSLSAARYRDMARVAEEAGVRSYGYLPFDRQNVIESRHLGLVTAGEIQGLRGKLANLGELARETLDLDGLLDLARTAPDLETPVPWESGQNTPSKMPGEVPIGPSDEVTASVSHTYHHVHELVDRIPGDAPVCTPVGVPAKRLDRLRIAVARDAAFCFLYSETLDALEQAGFEIVFFSPLKDSRLPENTGALYLCGGYPELHADELSRNASMLGDIAKAVRDGIPTLAECGGFMYLHRSLDGSPMVGVIDADVSQTDRLQRFGYVTLTAKADNLLCRQGETLRGHEFHYWDSSDPGISFIAQKAGRDTQYVCVHASQTIYAGFPHVAFTDAMARRFAEKAAARLSPITATPAPGTE